MGYVIGGFHYCSTDECYLGIFEQGDNILSLIIHCEMESDTSMFW